MPLYSSEVSWQNNSEASLSFPHKFCHLQYMTVAMSASKFVFMAIEIKINIFVPVEKEITI